MRSGYAVVGAPLQNAGVGATYVGSDPLSGVPLQPLAAPTLGGGEVATSRSTRVAIANDWLASCTIFDNGPSGGLTAAGACFMYQNTSGTWQYSQTIRGPSPANGRHFGTAVAMCGTTLVATDTHTSTLVNGGTFTVTVTGAAHVYLLVGTTWTFSQTLVPTATHQLHDVFLGRAVALSGNTLAVSSGKEVGGTAGQFYSAPGILNQDAVFVFKRTSVGASYTDAAASGGAHLHLPNSDQAVNYGISLALCEPRLVVGSPNDASGTDTAYVYTQSGTTWSLTLTLLSTDAGLGATSGAFGTSVGVSGTTILVGAPNVAATGGTVYRYLTTSGTPTVPVGSYTAPGPIVATARFGAALAIDSTGEFIVGAPTTTSVGNAYIFSSACSVPSAACGCDPVALPTPQPTPLPTPVPTPAPTPAPTPLSGGPAFVPNVPNSPPLPPPATTSQSPVPAPTLITLTPSSDGEARAVTALISIGALLVLISVVGIYFQRPRRRLAVATAAAAATELLPYAQRRRAAAAPRLRL